MGKEKKLLKSKERKSRAEVSAFLHQLADKIEEGQLILSRGEKDLKLELPYHLVLEILVEDEDKKRKGIEHSLEVEIKWFDDNHAGGPLELK